MLHSLYQLLIYPIELLLGFAYSLIYETRHDVGLSIIGVSIVVNILLLPLYNRADAISEEERKKQERMALPLSHIKKTFKGDERFMMLQAYYRKMDYHPLNSLRSSLPLLLQIPFFIAAYHFLSNLSALSNMSFLWINNLASPDGIIVIPAIGIDVMPKMILLNGFKINVLPILMTFINIVSTIIYTKGSPMKEKVQLYVMALLFLILLYNSPSGLVIYWTMNNIFSLLKNIVLGIKKKLVKKDRIASDVKEKKDMTAKGQDFMFVLGSILLTLVVGALIPSSVIVASPAEFVMIGAYKNPLAYAFNTFLISTGFFLIWIPVFYYLMSDAARRVTGLVICLLGCMSLIDFLFFGKVDIYISPELKYSKEPEFSSLQMIVNILVLIAVIVVMMLIIKRKKNWIKSVYGVLIAGVAILACINVVKTQLQLSRMPYLKNDAANYQKFPLSKNGKNVIVIMLDRAIGTYIPFVMAEKPELMEKFSGFVYYPNTISHGDCTITGSPGLFGGYEYTPVEMNKRDTEKLVDKHNEALKVMPIIFSENGYKTTVYDPPLAGYKPVSDLSIYDEYPLINAYSLHNSFVSPEMHDFLDTFRKRSFFMYSICKASPLALQPYIYDGGKYNYPDHRTFLSSDYLDYYSALQNLNKLTELQNTDQNTFMMMNNEITHWTCELQLPDYTFSGNVNNRGLETGYRNDNMGHSFELGEGADYYSNIAALILLGQWFDYLRANGVYDNTRIIIVSDHGDELGSFENLIYEEGVDMQKLIPLLMYKDFNSDRYSESFELMTNADTPALAMEGLITDPVNPFTNKKIDASAKPKEEQIALYDYGFTLDTEKTVYEKPKQKWFSIHDNVYDMSDWKHLSGSVNPDVE